MTSALHATDCGPRNAPVVVLLHSIATNSSVWGAQAAVWAHRFRVLSVDLPGHGASPPVVGLDSLEGYGGLLQAFLDERGIERCALVGLSLGGMISQSFALQSPERVRSLVLANTSSTTPQVMKARWEERKQQATADGMESQVAATLERWFTPEFTAARPLTVEWVADMIRGTHVEGYNAAIAAIQSADLFGQLGGVRVPTLLIAGSRDVATTPEIMGKIGAQIPGARLQLLAEASHISSVSNPLDFTESVGEFLNECV